MAAKAGFERPYCTACDYGLVAWALLRQCAGFEPARLGALDIRFAAPVYPANLITEIWRVPAMAKQYQLPRLRRRNATGGVEPRLPPSWPDYSLSRRQGGAK